MVNTGCKAPAVAVTFEALLRYLGCRSGSMT